MDSVLEADAASVPTASMPTNVSDVVIVAFVDR